MRNFTPFSQQIVEKNGGKRYCCQKCVREMCNVPHEGRARLSTVNGTNPYVLLGKRVVISSL